MAQVLEFPSRSNAVPSTEKRPVLPVRRRNADLRPREHLTEREVERLIEGARAGRHGHRDATALLLAYRHGLRVSELVDVRWSDVDFEKARLNVRRRKNSVSGVHPLAGDELRALRRLQRESESGEFLFLSERGGPMDASAVRKIVTKAAKRAKLEALKVHPHMLRHACGYRLANRGTDTRTLQAFLGHANIQNTVLYTALDASRFRDLWRD